MKKIKFVIVSAIIIICLTANSALAAEVTKASSATPRTPAGLAPAASATPAKPPAGPAANATTSATPAQIQPPALTTAPADNYIYNPSGKPDPFRPFVTVDTTVVKQQIAKKAEVSMFPLQRAETEKYRVVGIAGDKNHRVAICEDTSKKFYPLHIGTRIGLFNGKVIDILADRVIVEEYETKKPKRVILKLHKN